ncbi:MAG TPA: flagellar hook capping FlgD N-terminal domain-containing protein [Balneolales bacterium]|nr:flagellar hook capping FlgD N-terminal domain-containing protein [Balneolales bacterium]
MNVSNVNTTNSVPASSSDTGTAANNTLGKNQFLQLLVAQMKNQDPVNPLKSTEFATQLAQFNSVEQLINLNSGLKTLANSQNTMSTGLNNTLAASLVGKNIKALSNSIYSKAGESSDVQFSLAQPATDVTVTISDAAGNTVRTGHLKNLGQGDNKWTWNGKDDSGHSVPEGTYNVQIDAKNGSDTVKSYSFIDGNAMKVKYSGKGVELKVDNLYVNLGDVLEIGAGSS